MGHNYAREIVRRRAKRRKRLESRLAKDETPTKRVRSRRPVGVK
jgi:hypothetical protein